MPFTPFRAQKKATLAGLFLLTVISKTLCFVNRRQTEYAENIVFAEIFPIFCFSLLHFLKICVIIGIYTKYGFRCMTQFELRGIFMARRYDSEDAKRRILSACVRLFIEKGYKRTTMNDIIHDADVSAGTFQNIFRTKDGVLMELAHVMFDGQFGSARAVVGKNASPVLLYAVETSIQMTLAELNENLREIYVEAYTHPETAEYIYQHTSTELMQIFGKYLPCCRESDFYEMEIGSAGLMRSYMARPCDKYFTLAHKLERFLSMSLSAYRVPEEEQRAVLDAISKTDIVAVSNGVMQKLFEMLAMKFEFELK